MPSKLEKGGQEGRAKLPRFALLSHKPKPFKKKLFSSSYGAEKPSTKVPALAQGLLVSIVAWWRHHMTRAQFTQDFVGAT